MATIITSNGSKWAGQSPDSVSDLLAVLATTPLEPTFERYGNFVLEARQPGAMRFWGNFRGVSHVFDVETDDASLAYLLRAAIRRNQRSAAYKALKPRRILATVEG